MTTDHRPDMTRPFGRNDEIDPIWRAKTKKAGEHIVSYSFVTDFQWMNRRWGHCSAIGLKRITPFSYVSRNIKRRGITTAFVKGKSDTRPKTSIHETFPISLEWKNVSLHHSFAVSWTQLLIKCDYSLCNGKTVRSVRVQKVLVAHQRNGNAFGCHGVAYR